MSPAAPVRAGFVNHYTGYGGAELMLLTLLEGIDRTRVQPLLFAPDEGLLTERARALGVEVHVVPVGSALLEVTRGGASSRSGAGAAAAALPAAVIRLARAFRRARVDVVVTNSAKAHVYGSLAGALARRPVMWRIHDTMDSADFGGSTRRMLLQIGRRIPHRILAVSDSTGRPLAAGGIPPDRISTLYNGIDLAALRADAPPLGERPVNAVPRVGSVGRLTPLKGHGVVLDAAAELLRRGTEARFVIAGAAAREAPDHLAELRARADALGIAGSVEFISPFDDLTALICSLDVMVAGSVLPDSLPTTVIESMTLGVPVVATSLGGAPELLREGVTGYLIPADDPIAMADRVEDLIKSSDTRSAFGAAAWSDASERFDLETFVAAFATQIETVATCPGGWVRAGRPTRLRIRSGR